eukprot:CAMPEP_0201963972 /NCGR_PEP_ID=MMETSP0904-20121228/9715_1 /ASSEMBLY_ACC=CAM_ASM_000553 /TAXON_ID=420261 /ORGANISM="Thalassiosira antarctica, Strain CCMP982" /LENGTH=539 /DNA_ID=CAMNT_0048510719 /DNA_START=447 /DNA_END=2066 /DNA_ORIENTATION=-
MAFRIALFYKYTPISDPADFVSTQNALCSKLGLTGRLLVGAEGINGTLSCPVSSSGLQDWIDHTGSLPGFEDVDWKLSQGDVAPFGDTLTVKVVNEIVATGNAAVGMGDINEYGGRHLSPQDFHSALVNADRNTVVIDVRNTFEHAIGRFETGAGLSAIEPKMQAFTEFDGWCEKVAPSLKNKKVLMYCTGGIRCEKASVMLTQRGVGDVSQLQGGIHRYMDAFPDGDGLWRGKNFVFDNRVSMSSAPPPMQQQQQPPLPGVDAGGAARGDGDEEDNRAVIGRCVECRVKYDVLSGNRICALCRDLVLVCPRCATSLREYHCHAHQALKHAFFSFLDDFTVEQLEDQRTQLAKVVPPRGRHCGGVGRSSNGGGVGHDVGGPGGDGRGVGGPNKRVRPETLVNSGGEMVENDAAERVRGEQVEKVEPVNAPLKPPAGSTTLTASGAQEAALGAADVGVADGGLTFPAAARRDVVRACRKQLAKVDAALERAKVKARVAGGPGGASDLSAWQSRCRSCGLQGTVCSKSRVGTLTRCAAKRL